MAKIARHEESMDNTTSSNRKKKVWSKAKRFRTKKPKIKFELLPELSIFQFSDAEWSQLQKHRDLGNNHGRLAEFRSRITLYVNWYCLAVKSKLTHENLHYELSRIQTLLDEVNKSAKRLAFMFEVDEALNIHFFKPYGTNIKPNLSLLSAGQDFKQKASDYLEDLPVLTRGNQTSLVFPTVERIFSFIHNEDDPIERSIQHRKVKKGRTSSKDAGTLGTGSLNDIEFFHFIFTLASKVTGVVVGRSEVETALKEAIRIQNQIKVGVMMFEDYSS